MKMTPALLVIGGIMVFWASVFIVIILPSIVWQEPPSAAWQPWSDDEAAGHDLYVRNGCSYCHSQYVRVMDWGEGAERIAQRGDYVNQLPAILGTERTGPDLSQEGGEHPEDWQIAHFINPRNTRPLSLMPSWEFLGMRDIRHLTAYVRSLGGKDATFRAQRQEEWKPQAADAYAGGPAANIQWLHDHVPAPWHPMPNPYPATDAALQRGHKIYQDFCAGCHGVVGDGNGPAKEFLNPPPLNFTELRDHLVGGQYIGGIFYYQVMNGITGTGMPYFKRELESEKIWDVSNYIAVDFVGYTDAETAPLGIDASYEPEWKNNYSLPGADEK